jgi:hypothetical protein
MRQLWTRRGESENLLDFGHVFLKRLPELQAALPPGDSFLRWWGSDREKGRGTDLLKLLGLFEMTKTRPLEMIDPLRLLWDIALHCLKAIRFFSLLLDRSCPLLISLTEDMEPLAKRVDMNSQGDGVIEGKRDVLAEII